MPSLLPALPRTRAATRLSQAKWDHLASQVPRRHNLASTFTRSRVPGIRTPRLREAPAPALTHTYPQHSNRGACGVRAGEFSDRDCGLSHPTNFQPWLCLLGLRDLGPLSSPVSAMVLSPGKCEWRQPSALKACRFTPMPDIWGLHDQPVPGTGKHFPATEVSMCKRTTPQGPCTPPPAL